MERLKQLHLPKERSPYIKPIDYIYNSQQNSVITEGAIPLCVPRDMDYKVIKGIGASKCFIKNTWHFPFNDIKQPEILPYLPLIYRYDLEPPFIKPNLVPQPIWGINLRSLLPTKIWGEIKHSVYEHTDYICTICGGKGNDWPIECNEIWEYVVTDKKGIAKLTNLIGLCPNCHRIQHLGKANVDNVLQDTIEYMGFINCWEPKIARKKADEAFNKWEQLSKITLWDFDFTWFNNYFGTDLNISKNRVNKLQQRFLNIGKS